MRLMAEQLNHGSAKSVQQTKRKLISKESKQTKKIKHKPKKIVQEVIDLEQEQIDNKLASHSETFINELSKKCNIFFGWIANTHSHVLAEHFWKNEMLAYASRLYPELNNDQLQRLVDRDWRYMGEEDRQKLISQYEREPNDFEIQRQINQYEVNKQVA